MARLISDFAATSACSALRKGSSSACAAAGCSAAVFEWGFTLPFGDLSFYTSRKNKGTCNMSDSTRPLAQFGSAIGRGTIRFVGTG